MADPTFPEISVPGTGDLYARMTTTLGTMVLRLEEQRVPNTVKNFVGLATGTIAWADPATQTVCVVLTSLPARAVSPHPRDLAAKAIAHEVRGS